MCRMQPLATSAPEGGAFRQSYARGGIDERGKTGARERKRIAFERPIAGLAGAQDHRNHLPVSSLSSWMRDEASAFERPSPAVTSSPACRSRDAIYARQRSVPIRETHEALLLALLESALRRADRAPSAHRRPWPTAKACPDGPQACCRRPPLVQAARSHRRRSPTSPTSSRRSPSRPLPCSSPGRTRCLQVSVRMSHRLTGLLGQRLGERSLLGG